MRQRVFQIIIFIILLVSVILRFNRYFDRWGLAYDQAHDAVIALYALKHNLIPLLGPFSSAGPFQTSGVWYWFIMVGTLLIPPFINSPWFLLTALYVFFVFGMIYLANSIEGRKFAIIVGIISAISTAQVAQAVNLTNQSPLSITSLLALLTAFKYVKTKKIRWVFLLGFFISLSASIHLQGVVLIIISLVLFLLFGIPSVMGIVVFILGLSIPFLPILIFDFSHNFINIKNMIYYFLYDQYKISLDVLGRRWKTFLIEFLPREWAHVVGGQPLLGGMLGVGVLIVLLNKVRQPAKRKNFIFFFLCTLGMITIMRYTRTPLFSSYLVFMHPFIIFLSSYVVLELFSFNAVLGVLFFGLISFYTFKGTLAEVNYGQNMSDRRGTYWVDYLKNIYPNEKFSIYDYQYKSNLQSVVLSLYLEKANLISEQGIKIGVSRSPRDSTQSARLIFVDEDRELLDVSSSSSAELEKSGWVKVNPENIYESTEYWIERDRAKNNTK